MIGSINVTTVLRDFVTVNGATAEKISLISINTFWKESQKVHLRKTYVLVGLPPEAPDPSDPRGSQGCTEGQHQSSSNPKILQIKVVEYDSLIIKRLEEPVSKGCMGNEKRTGQDRTEKFSS